MRVGRNRAGREAGGDSVGDTLIAAICPRCGAGLRFPEGMESAYCMYCGTQVLIGKAAATSRLVECTVCDGVGKVDVCRVCKGSGNCTWSVKGSSTRQGLTLGFSSHCENGTCTACKGSGSYGMSGCPGCNGTGKCPSCHGSAKCPACRGMGVLPNPAGTVECPSCGGRGVRSLDAGGASSVPGKCPSCGRQVQPDWNKCPNCGCMVRWNTGR